jgi:hypothetical protein
MIDLTAKLSVSRQAIVLGISRGSGSYKPRPVSDADLKLMHRIAAAAIAAHLAQVPPTPRQVAMPLKQALMTQGRGMVAIQFHHQLRHSGLRRGNTTMIGGQSEVAAQRRLQAVAIQHLTLDLRSLLRFLAENLHREEIAFLFGNVGYAAGKYPRLP